MTKLFPKPPGRHFGPVFDLRAQCLSLGFSAPITDPATRGGRRPQWALPAFSPPSLPPSPSLLISLSCGWSLPLRSGQDSVNEVVAVESRGAQAGREEEEAPDVSGSGKDMSKCIWRSLLGAFLVQEHNKMSAPMSFSSFPSFFPPFWFALSVPLHHLFLFPVSHNKL